MNNDIYNEIATNVEALLPKGWQNLVLYSQITKSSYEFFFYVKVNNNYIQCFDLEGLNGITRKQLREAFKQLNTIIKPDYEEKHWYVMTYNLDSSGKFKVDYEYTDFSEKSVEYKELWKVKYIK